MESYYSQKKTYLINEIFLCLTFFTAYFPDKSFSLYLFITHYLSNLIYSSE